MDRLALRLKRLPHDELVEFAAQAAAASLALRNEADRRIAVHAPTPEWALAKVLLSPDLAPVIVGKLGLEDVAAAKTCSAWRGAWKATVARRPWLRPAPTQPPPLENIAEILDLAVQPDGERLYVSAVDNDSTTRLLLLDRHFQVLQSIARDRESSFFATELGLYESDNGLRRLQLTDDGALLTLAEVGERCFAVAAAPDGTLFANVMDAGCQEYVASYDPLTLEERFRFGADRLENVRDLAVFANELFVMDCVHDEPYNCFHVFSLDGEYLREVLVDGVKSPSAFCFSNGRMYVVDDGSTFDGSTRILVLTPEGATLQTYEHEAFEPTSVCAFAGGLVLRAPPRDQGRIGLLCGL